MKICFQIGNILVLTSLLMFDVNAQLNQSMEWFFRKPFPITGLVSKVLTFPKLRAASKLKLKTNNCLKLWTAALSVIKVAPARGIPMQHSVSSNINLLKWKNSKSFDYMCYRLCNFCDLSVSYLISLKYLLLENIAHDGFQHFFVCTWLCLTLPWFAMVYFRSIYSSFERSNGTGWDVFNSPYTCFKHKNSLKDNQWYFILAREWILEISLSLCLGNSLCFISSVW